MKIEYFDEVPRRIRKNGFKRNDIYDRLESVKMSGRKVARLTPEPDDYTNPRTMYSVIYNAVKRYREFSSIFNVELINGETWLVRTDL